MLSAKMAKIILTVYPDLNDLKRKYSARIKRLRSFDYNITGIDAERVLTDYLVAAMTLDALKRFHTSMNATLGLLSERERKLISAEFFEGKDKESIMKVFGLTRSGLKYIRSKALRKVQFYVEMLGFDEENILEYFNTEPYFIDAAEEVDAGYRFAARFGKSNG